jgi:4-alpha-glucanotransferase
MRILQFGFSDRGSHLYLPHRFVPNTVAYTGTHDNNTTLGWWQEDISYAERINVQAYLQTIQHDGDIVWAMIRGVARSVANYAIFPMQDILHLGSDARMNKPSAGEGNWTWRYASNALHPDFAIKMSKLMELTDRDGYEEPIEGKAAGQPTEEASKRAELGTTV